MVDPLSYFSFQSVLHNWRNKSCGVYYPVFGMVHIREHMLLTGKIAHVAAAGDVSLYERSFTILCPTPYNRK